MVTTTRREGADNLKVSAEYLKDKLEELVMPIREAGHLVGKDDHSPRTLTQAVDELEEKHERALRLLVEGERQKAQEFASELEPIATKAKELVRHNHALKEETRKSVLRLHHEISRIGNGFSHH